jgi:hypothetical protein
MPEKIYRYVDLSGYAFTGKHAYIDLCREFQGYYVPHYQYEFNLIRIQGGIRDLETALVDDWSPIRSNAAIQRFRRLVRRLGTKNSWLDPRTWWVGTGWNYNDYFHGQFFELSQQYLDTLIQAQWITEWPYPLAEISNLELFWRKLKRQLGVKTAYDFPVCLSGPEDFLELTRHYLASLLEAFVPENLTGVHTVVMHNSLEPFNPDRALRYFYDARCLVVDRDPRDTYVDGLWYRPVAVPVNEFIKRYRLYRSFAQKNAGPSSQVLRLRFEDLVMDYDRTVPRVLEFLGEEPSAHVRPRQYFDPAVSGKNVGLWRTYQKPEEIEAIYRELREFCYE